MRTNYHFLYSALFTMFIFTSCVNDDKNLSVPTPKQTSELNVPDNFDWSSTQGVALSIQSPSATTASFYLNETCSDDSQFAVLPVPSGKTTFNFDLPYSQKAIYVQYPQGNGNRTIKSSINGADTRAVTSDDIIFTEPNVSQGNLYNIKIPAYGGYGTIMFEDTWPGIGDYDFNDVVVNYKMSCELEITGETTDNPTVDLNIKVSLKIRALGGSYPYNFAMQFGTWGDRGPAIPSSDMTGITDVNCPNTNIKVEKLEVAHPAVMITGLNTLRKANFYNTTQKEDEGVQIDFTIKIKGDWNVQQQRCRGMGDPKAFDYFLRHQTSGREIHMMGFAPTTLYKNYDKDVTNGGDIYYQNKQNLVWGLKVPKAIGWPVEKQDITSVYTSFANWVESGGTLLEPNNYDPLIWYNDINSKLCIPN
ncbi:LruC domain-containing protein [Bacteroides sp. AM16-13]|jgi:LruC domain-containing protein|uniref:LruC domain-containing protein n=1 Tax=Bacteroides sp. AM16-13 TaxID=2292938 RepID=UPI000E71EC30|nr:LruC domain-containing protein [Bacteroides sp. AM16-13]RGD50445.1 LruC domain-containing protein [Bacteroides sp. AM16-13]